MRHARALLAIAAVTLAGAACASAGQSEAEGMGVGDAPIRVAVDNRNMYNVIVYARYRGQSHRLGEVTALGEQTLSSGGPIPAGVPVSFQVRSIGPSTRFQSQDFFLDGGDVVFIRVLPNIRQSTVSVRQ